MRNSVMRLSAVTGVGAAVSVLGLVAASTPGTARTVPRAVRAISAGTAHTTPAASRQLWVKRYRAGGAQAMAISRAGDRLFVTGSGGGGYITVGYRASSGAWLWARRYHSPFGIFSDATALAVSPDGKRVFVTGSAHGKTPFDYVTIAYDAATGAQLWLRRYNSPGESFDTPYALAVSPDGKTVFVTGASMPGVMETANVTTVAYGAATGTQRWVRHYNGPAGGDDAGHSLAVSPTGKTVYVSGTSAGTSRRYEYLTIAYNAATGARRWVQRYLGPGDSMEAAMRLSPAGGKLFVTGAGNRAYLTVGYRAATGSRLWVRRYKGPGRGPDDAASLAVSPSGRTVFVTGTSHQAGGREEYTTIAYGTATGRWLWMRLYRGPGNRDTASAVAVSHTGRVVYVTGSSYRSAQDPDYATVAYDAVTGARLWVQRYNGPGNGRDTASAMVASPAGHTVFVTGSSRGVTSARDIATIAYRG